MTLCNSAAKYQHFGGIYCFSSGKKIGVMVCFETLIPTYQAKIFHNPEYDTTRHRILFGMT